MQFRNWGVQIRNVKLLIDVPDLALYARYLDNGTLVGSLENLAEALSIIKKYGPLVGLKLNRDNSVLFVPEESDPSRSPLPSNIPVVLRDSAFLAAPLGLLHFVRCCMTKLQNWIFLWPLCTTWEMPIWRWLSYAHVLPFPRLNCDCSGHGCVTCRSAKLERYWCPPLSAPSFSHSWQSPVPTPPLISPLHPFPCTSTILSNT